MGFRDRIEQEILRRQNGFIPANDNEMEESFTSTFFGIENLRNLPASLDLRFASGKSRTIPYGHLPEFEHDPTEGIIITTNKLRVVIEGRGLVKLHRYLALYRVVYIQENIGADTTEEGLFVKNIIIEDI